MLTEACVRDADGRQIQVGDLMGSENGRGRKARIVAIEQVAAVFLVTFEWVDPPTRRWEERQGARWQLNHINIQTGTRWFIQPREATRSPRSPSEPSAPPPPERAG